MKDDLPLNGPGFWVPVGGITEIRDHPQVFHALQVGEDFSGVGQEVWENVVDVALVTTSKDVWKRISSTLFYLERFTRPGQKCHTPEGIALRVITTKFGVK